MKEITIIYTQRIGNRGIVIGKGNDRDKGDGGG
jgi:hypothetical protein